MSKPRRIQRKRTKGWRMPESAVYVGRPSRWGNPFPIDHPLVARSAQFLREPTARAAAVRLYRLWMNGARIIGDGDGAVTAPIIEFTSGSKGGSLYVHGGNGGLILTPHAPDVTALRGRDLACWCPLDQPCHADVLLELANRDSLLRRAADELSEAIG